MTKSANATATGTLVSNGATALGAWIRSTGTAGTVVLRDNGAGGTIKVTLDTPAAVRGDYVPFPGGGILFATDVHVTLTSVDGITIFYEGG